MADPKKCAHPACSCIPPAGKKFCSDVCESAKGMLELTCQCKHEGCTGKL